MMYTYYDYLDVAPGVSPARIDVAYTQILSRFGFSGVGADQDLSGLLRQIHAAYDVLSNPEKRQRYDAELDRAAQAADVELKRSLDSAAGPLPRVAQPPAPGLLDACAKLAA